MLILTELAKLVCRHELGVLQLDPVQALVTVEQKRILVEPDPVGRGIRGCPIGPPLKPCLRTLNVKVGYSDLVRINGRKMCLDTIVGLTDGPPPGSIEYKVNFAGQEFVAEK